MKEYPVGSVCVVIHADDAVEMIGKEVTITEPLDLCLDVEGLHIWLGYSTDVVFADGTTYAPPHEYLRLKKLPPDEAFDKFLNKLTEPVQSEKPVEDLV